jgi:hypothetical protein
LQRLFTVSLLCNGSAIKGRGASSVGNDGRRFSSFKCVGYGSFRRGAAVTTEAAVGSIKAEQRRPRGGEKKQSKTEGRNPAKQRKKIHRKKQRKRNKETQKKPTLTSLSPQFPLQIRKRKNPSSKP